LSLIRQSLPECFGGAKAKGSVLQRSRLDILYKKYNRRRYVHPDPLEFLYQYKEIIKNVIVRFGSLHECFLAGFSEDDENIIPAMTFFSTQLTDGRNKPGHLVALPEKGSACKRMNLFLRWMVRKDRVDPGGWNGIPLSKLIIPLDTHMHRISLSFKLTKRIQANMRTALEITSGYKKIVPDDPVKYDFALTRFGIRDDMDIDAVNKALLKTGGTKQKLQIVSGSAERLFNRYP
jgi:hypothetical protein